MTPQEKEDELHQITAYMVADIKTTFGPGPALASEDPKLYDRILFDVVRARWPRDFIQRMLCRDIANAIWIDLRLDRHTRYTYDSRLIENRQQKRLPHRGGLNQAEINDQVLDPASEGTLQGQTFAGLAKYLLILDELRSTNFYRRNVSLQLSQEYRPTSMPRPAYMERKEHLERAESEMAARNEGIQALMDKRTDGLSSQVVTVAVTEPTALTFDEYGPATVESDKPEASPADPALRRDDAA